MTSLFNQMFHSRLQTRSRRSIDARMMNFTEEQQFLLQLVDCIFQVNFIDK